LPRNSDGKKEQVIVQVAEKILFRTFKDWLKSLLPKNFPRDKKGSPLLPKDAAGFQAVGKQIMDDHFSILSNNQSCTDKNYVLAVTQIQQHIAMFVYFNRSDKPEYKCL